MKPKTNDHPTEHDTSKQTQHGAPEQEAAADLETQADGDTDALLDELKAQVAELQAQNTDLAEQFVRSQAEAQNVRRRAEEDVTKARKFAIEAFAESLLPALDSLEAGLAVENATREQMHEGVDATLRQLKAALERNKVLEVAPALGSAFDPNQHQAIGSVPAPEGSDFASNSIAQVLQKGYVISDRILRPALVMVVA